MSAPKRRAVILTAAGAGGALLTSATAFAAARGWRPRPGQVKVMLPTGQSNPAIATGVATGESVALYTSSGLGPDALNPDAPARTPEYWTDPSMTEDAEGVTVTEAQALLVLRKISDNLAVAGLSAADVITMKCYLMKPPGAELADYAGWNRAYRQFYANVDLASGDTVPVPMGTSAPKPPILANRARPARATMEVASLAVPGWLVEVEVAATYRRK